MKIKTNDKHYSLSEIMVFTEACVRQIFSIMDAMDFCDMINNDDGTTDIVVPYCIYDAFDIRSRAHRKERVTFTLSKEETDAMPEYRKPRMKYLSEIFYNYKMEVDSQLTNLIDGGYRDLQLLVWVNGLTPIVLSWKKLCDHKSKSPYLIEYTDNYNMKTYNPKSIEDNICLGQLQALWMIAVSKFGSYASTPRYGEIRNEDIDKFFEWVDAICYYDISHACELDIFEFKNNIKMRTEMITKDSLYRIMFEWITSELDECVASGGFWYYGSGAGGFCWALNFGVGSRDRHIGAQSCYGDEYLGYDIWTDDRKNVNIKIRRNSIEFIEESEFKDFTKEDMKELYYKIMNRMLNCGALNEEDIK